MSRSIVDRVSKPDSHSKTVYKNQNLMKFECAKHSKQTKLLNLQIV